MLTAVGIVAGKNRRESWAHFMIAFGVWDIFYYLWLKLFLDWPPGMMTWDLLFLVPVPWVAPVLAPVLISVALIVAGLIVLFYESQGRPLVTRARDWAFATAGGLIVIASFCWDYDNVTKGGYPNPFHWPLFFAGFAVAAAAFVAILRRRRAASV